MSRLKPTTFLLLASIYFCTALEYRLPDTITPTFYNLSLTIDPKSSNYTGTVNITVRTTTDLNEIYIHEDGDSLTISSTLILNDKDECNISSSNEADISVISCSKSLEQNKDNFIYLEFTGKFSTGGEYGLVKSSYGDEKNEQVIIESNFKPTYARKAFPCLDEPHFKANFSLEVKHPNNYTVLSNALAAATEESGGYQVTKFVNTPAISTYLLSIFISTLKETESSPEENLDFKIFTRPEVASLSNNIANTYHRQIINELATYTGTSYEKLNDTESYLVAVPDYLDGTGEFGLFTFKESELLDEGVMTTRRVKQNIIQAITYKLSHEWYGGGVATSWWSDVWANEAFATYLKYIIPDEIDDELQLTDQFVLEVTQKMLQNDAYSFAQPLSSNESDINDNWDIENKINSANYEKGASLLHMINVIAGGKEKFRLTLQKHYQARSETDTNGTDLLKDLLADIKEYDYYTYFQKWVFSPGFPLVTVTLQSTNLTDVVSISQKRFLYPTSDAVTEDDSKWYVPLTSASQLQYPSNITIDSVLLPDDNMIYIITDGIWVIFNDRGSGFYRVNYDEILWRRILDGLRSNRSAFPALQRAHMLDDIFSIARIGDVSYSLVFEMTNGLVNETEYYPWYSALNGFSYLLGKVGDAESETNLKNYILSLMENVLRVPGTNFTVASDGQNISVLKGVMILDWACNLGHEGCIAFATSKFQSYKKSPTSLEDYNTRSVIFCYGLRHSQDVENDWLFLWGVYNSSQSVHEQNDILRALGCIEDKGHLQYIIVNTFTAYSGVKRQDTLLIIRSVLSNPIGLQAVMELLETNFAGMYSFYDMRIFSEIIYSVAEKLITDSHVSWLKDLLSDKILDDYEDVRSKAITLALVNNYWQNHFQGDVASLIPTITTTEATTTSIPTEPDDTTTASNTTTTEPGTTQASEPTGESENTSESQPSTESEHTTESVTTTEPSTTTESKSQILSTTTCSLLLLCMLFAVLY